MQPKRKMNKTLLASALILGLGNAFHASSDTFTATIETISDVTFSKPEATNIEVNFGAGIKGTAVGETCAMNGKTGLDETLLLFDINEDGNDDAAVTSGGTGTNYGELSGNACVSGTGTPLILEITGSPGSLVSVNVPNFNDGEIAWTPTSESCVVDYDGVAQTSGNEQDTCRSLATNTLTAVGLAKATGSEADADLFDNYTAAGGATRMVLSGQVEILQALTAGTEKAVQVDVLVTYE